MCQQYHGNTCWNCMLLLEEKQKCCLQTLFNVGSSSSYTLVSQETEGAPFFPLSINAPLNYKDMNSLEIGTLSHRQQHNLGNCTITAPIQMWDSDLLFKVWNKQNKSKCNSIKWPNLFFEFLKSCPNIRNKGIFDLQLSGRIVFSGHFSASPCRNISAL